MKIENMRKVDCGTIKAFFSVNFDKLIIHSFKLIQQDGLTMWCRPPDEKYTDKKGKTAYKKVVDITDLPLMGKIARAAIEEYQK